MKPDPDLLCREQQAFLSAAASQAGGGSGPEWPCPMISFEGLPGAGKTTQVRRLLHAFAEQGMPVREVALPVQTGTAAFRRLLYKDPAAFEQAAALAPWLNPFLVVADILVALDSLRAEPPAMALMSRGLVSTLAYAYPTFRDSFGPDEAAWAELFRACAGFPRPSAVIVLDILPAVAARRIALRAAPGRRPKDADDRLARDYALWMEVCRRVEDQGVPVHRIDATAPMDEVTQRCREIVSGYLRP